MRAPTTGVADGSRINQFGQPRLGALDLSLEQGEDLVLTFEDLD
jgi:hypothetical protein